jgi:hypothetical protein
MHENDLLQRIAFNPAIFNSKTIIHGTRFEEQHQEPFK